MVGISLCGALHVRGLLPQLLDIAGVPRIRASIGPSFNFLFVRGHVWTVVQVHQRSDSDVTCGR